MKRNKFPFEILDYQQQHKPRTTKTHRGEVASCNLREKKRKEEAINTPNQRYFGWGNPRGP